MIRDLSKKVTSSEEEEEFDSVEILSEVEDSDLQKELENRGYLVYSELDSVFIDLKTEAILDELKERQYDWTQQDLKKILGLKPYATQEELVNEVKQLFLK